MQGRAEAKGDRCGANRAGQSVYRVIRFGRINNKWIDQVLDRVVSLCKQRERGGEGERRDEGEKKAEKSRLAVKFSLERREFEGTIVICLNSGGAFGVGWEANGDDEADADEDDDGDDDEQRRK